MEKATSWYIVYIVDELAMAKYHVAYVSALIMENSMRILFTSEIQLTATSEKENADNNRQGLC
jgi:hypothetical protein